MKSLALLTAILALMPGCVARRPDHFYVLEAQPAEVHDSRSSFVRQVTLRVTVPSLVDRGEMVLSTPDGVQVLDHERWAAPLADLMTTALGQDIERRRGDVVVVPRSAGHAGLPLVKIAVDIDRVNLSRGNRVSIEAHWRISDAGSGKESVGREVFVAPLQSATYATLADGLSTCISLLADRLVADLPAT